MIHRISVDAIDEGSTESWRVHVFTGAPSKRQDTAALQNLAVILRLSLACIITPRFEFPALTDGTCRTTASKEQDVDECVRDADKRGAAN